MPGGHTRTESGIKKASLSTFRRHQAFAVNAHLLTQGTKGAPDVLACLYGMFCGVEFKDGKTDWTRQARWRLQRHRLMQIEQAGGIGVVITHPDQAEQLAQACRDRLPILVDPDDRTFHVQPSLEGLPA